MADIIDLVSQGLNIGAQIYQGQLLKKQMKQTIRAQQAGSLPQLGMGLAATGPQVSGAGMFDPQGGFGGSAPGSGLDRLYNYLTGDAQTMDSGAMIPSGPQYALTTTPTGRQKLLAIRSIGQPMLWSGDLAACRRVAKVARKLGRFARGRRPR